MNCQVCTLACAQFGLAAPACSDVSAKAMQQVWGRCSADHMLSHTCASDCVKLGTLDPKDDFGEATAAGIRQSRNPSSRAEALECALPRKIWVPSEVDRSPLSSLLLGWEAEP